MKSELMIEVNELFDKFSIRQVLELYHSSKKTINHLMNGFIKVNQERIFQDISLNKGDILSIDFTTIIPVFPKVIVDHPIDILYEDDDFLIVDKKNHLLVYDDGNLKDNLTSRVQAYYQKQNYPFPVLPAHRLDEETSGMILYAKHPLALSYISQQFENRNIIKVYECLTEGIFTKKEGIINHPIGKDRHSNKMRVISSGNPAKTYYRVIDMKEDISRLKIVIESGRKHQIRVHLEHMGHPIIGDSLYQGKLDSRLMLHFKEIQFDHPRTKNKIKVTSKVPF